MKRKMLLLINYNNIQMKKGCNLLQPFFYVHMRCV